MAEGGATSGARVVSILVIVMLAAASLVHVATRLTEAVGIDFYYFWAVPTAARISGHTLGSPYTDFRRYRATLEPYVAASADPALRAVHRIWAGAPVPTASPLVYTAFAVPLDYSTWLRVLRVLQVGAFVGGCLLVGTMYRIGWLPALSLALVSLLISQPVMSDLRVANVGTLQFAALAGLLALASLLPRVTDSRRRTALVAALSGASVAVLLFKPNVALVIGLLGAHVAIRFGPRLFGLGVLSAAPVAAALLVAPCLYFGSWIVWQDWLGVLGRMRGIGAAAAGEWIDKGNYATSVVVLASVGGTWTGRVISGLVLVLLGLSLALAVAWRVRSGAGAIGPRSIFEAILGLLRDLHATAAIGILVTLAASPLTWLHYHILLLIPAVWVLTAARGGRLVPWLAAFGVLANAGVLGLGLWALGWASGIPATIALSWIPLWAAVLLVVADPRGEVSAPPAKPVGEAPTTPAKPAPSRPRRKR